ncbi:MAG: hypothetical protein K0R12_169 [Gammaproteobacteria bacterium]|nr:hypothetical protein [Gammaproteobacteria bacterium]
MFIPQKALVLTLSSLIDENFVFSPAQPEPKQLSEAVASRLQRLCFKEFSLFLLVPQDDPQAAYYQQALEKTGISYTVVSYLGHDMAPELKNNMKRQFNEKNIYFYDTEATNVACVQSVNIANAYLIERNNTLADSLQNLINTFIPREQVDSNDKPAPVIHSLYVGPAPSAPPLVRQSYLEPDFSRIPPSALFPSSSLSFVSPVAEQVNSNDKPVPVTHSLYVGPTPSAPPLVRQSYPEPDFSRIPPSAFFPSSSLETEALRKLQTDIQNTFKESGGFFIFKKIPQHVYMLCNCHDLATMRKIANDATREESIWRDDKVSQLYSVVAYCDYNAVSELRNLLESAALLPGVEYHHTRVSPPNLQDNPTHELPSFGQ